MSIEAFLCTYGSVPPFTLVTFTTSACLWLAIQPIAEFLALPLMSFPSLDSIGPNQGRNDSPASSFIH